MPQLVIYLGNTFQLYVFISKTLIFCDSLKITLAIIRPISIIELIETKQINKRFEADESRDKLIKEITCLT